MKIIKHGNIEVIKQSNIFSFECCFCGCVYIANTDECKENKFCGRHMSYECVCPDCGRINIKIDEIKMYQEFKSDVRCV